MTAQEFAYWLNGFAELSAEPPTAEQWQSIKEHLALTFRKVTPPGPGDISWTTAGPGQKWEDYMKGRTIGHLQATC